MKTVCPETDHFIGDFDADQRRDAVAQIRSQLSVIAEIGGEGMLTPASWGMFSLRLPPFAPPRTAEEDRKVLLEALIPLAEHAEREGVWLALEALNRYEDYMIDPLRGPGRRTRPGGRGGDRRPIHPGLRRLLPPQHRGGRPGEGHRRGRPLCRPRPRRRLEPVAARHRPPRLRRRLQSPTRDRLRRLAHPGVPASRRPRDRLARDGGVPAPVRRARPHRCATRSSSSRTPTGSAAHCADFVRCWTDRWRRRSAACTYLPFYRPYDGADAGFDPDDHLAVDPRLGTWDDLAALARGHDVTADLIVNHVSDRPRHFVTASSACS